MLRKTSLSFNQILFKCPLSHEKLSMFRSFSKVADQFRQMAKYNSSDKHLFYNNKKAKDCHCYYERK